MLLAASDIIQWALIGQILKKNPTAPSDKADYVIRCKGLARQRNNTEGMRRQFSDKILGFVTFNTTYTASTAFAKVIYCFIVVPVLLTYNPMPRKT